MAPFSSWPMISCIMSLQLPTGPSLMLLRRRIDGLHFDFAALLDANDVEAENLFACRVEFNVPNTTVAHTKQRLAHLCDVADASGLFHCLGKHIDVIVAGGGAQWRLIIGEIPLVEGLVAFDELLDRWLGLLRLLKVFRHIRNIFVDLILVLKRGTN